MQITGNLCQWISTVIQSLPVVVSADGKRHHFAWLSLCRVNNNSHFLSPFVHSLLLLPLQQKQKSEIPTLNGHPGFIGGWYFS